MDLKKAFEQLKFDSRLVEWNLRHGKLSKEELQKHLSTLTDESSKAEALDLDEGHGSANNDSMNGGHHN